MKKTLAVVMLLALAGPVLGGAKDVFEELTCTYTGGPYKDEVFKYRFMKPAAVEQGRKYPLILFLHGAGERGDDNVNQLKYLPELMAKDEYRKKHPCFVLAPQCRSGQKWVDVSWSAKASLAMPKEPSGQMAVAIAALRRAIKEEPVDTKRIYLTGLSMGGYGSWDLAARRPDWFAAVAPICGGGDEKQAARLVGLPLWAFHGDKDGAVPVQRSRTMIEAIKQAGGEPKYTEYAGMGHNAWDKAYGDPEGLLPWMFQQVKAKAPDFAPTTAPAATTAPAPATAPAPSPAPQPATAPATAPATSAGLTALTGPDSPLRKGDRIAFLGDSITQAGVGKTGYVTLIKNAVAAGQGDLGVAVIGAGISGNKVPDIQNRLDRDVIAKKANVVFIYIGINDVWHSLSKRGTPKDRYEEGLRDVIDRLKKTGATVILATPSVIGEKPDGSNPLDKMLDEYAAVSRKVAPETDTHLCDLRKAFLDYLKTHNPDNKQRGILTSDGVHLSAPGNRFVADQAAGAIAEALRKRK